MARCAVFASGTGTNFDKIQQALRAHAHHELSCLVCDKPQAAVVQKALAAGIPVLPISYTRNSDGKIDRKSAEQKIVAVLRMFAIDCIALAGFMRLISPELLSAFPGKILNIHPSLLPKYPGTHGIRDSISSKDERLGITIHFVDEGMDTGPILFQDSFIRNPQDGPEEEEAKIHALEHAAYPAVLIEFLDTLKGELS